MKVRWKLIGVLIEASRSAENEYLKTDSRFWKDEIFGIVKAARLSGEERKIFDAGCKDIGI